MSSLGAPLPVPFWATGVNYPSGSQPWSGQPLKVAPAGTFFAPDTMALPENFNYLFNQQANALNFGQAWAQTSPALNWTVNLNVPTAKQALQSVCWDELGLKWIAACTDNEGGNNLYILAQGADEQTYSQIGSTIAVIPGDPSYVAVAASKTTPGVYYVVYSVGSNSDIYLHKFSSGSWSGATTYSISGHVTDIAAMCFSSPSTSNEQLVITIAGALGDSYAGLAVAYDTVAHTFSAFTTASPTSGGWTCLQQNEGNYLLWSLNRANAPALFKSVDGVTWTSLGGTLSFLPSGTAVTALAYGDSSSGPTWFAAVVDNTGHSHIIQSGNDGVSWGSSTTYDFIGAYTISDLAALGTLLVGAVQELTSGGPSGLIFSPCTAGLTWYEGLSVLKPGNAQGVLNYIRPRMVENGQKIVQWNNQNLRFSAACGLPANGLI